MNSKELYLNTKPSTLFWKAALPGGISMLVSSLYFVFDSFFVGKFVGTTAFAALGLAMPLVIINFALSDLIAVGSSVPISILLGRKEEDKANNYFSSATLLIIITGLIMGILMYLTAPFFMKLMGADGELARFGAQYIRVYASLSPFITLTFANDNYLRISGKIKTSMVLNILMSIGTVILELLFILVFDWGIIGAALACALAMLLTSLSGVCMFLGGKLQLKYRKPKFEYKLIKDVVRNGLPAFLTNISGRIFSIVMNVALLKMGGEGAVAIYGILMTVGGMVEQMLYGVLDSLQPAIGYNYGATRFDRVKIIEKYCVLSGAVISIFFAIIMFAIPGPISIIFLEDIALIDLSKRALRLFCFGYLFKWISHALQSFLLAIDRAIPAMIISTSTAFVFPLIVLGLLLPLKLDGLWLNYTFTSILGSVLSLVIIFKVKDNLFNFDN